MQFTEANWSPEAIITRVRSEAQTEVDNAVKASLDAGRSMAATIAGDAKTVADFLKMVKSAGRLHSANVAVPAVETIAPNADGTLTIPFLSRIVKPRGPRKPKTMYFPSADATATDATPSA